MSTLATSPSDAVNAPDDPQSPDAPPAFDARFRDTFRQLLMWRRDVRRFRRDPLPEGAIDSLLGDAMLGPSVGNAQPWRWVVVEDPTRRAAVKADFEARNAEALAGYSGEKAQVYAGLKLSGLDDAPVHIAVFCDTETDRGAGLGRQTMPEMLAYSVVGAIQTLWLSARAQGIGVGWVSIIDPDTVTRVLDVDPDWSLVAYLCVGYPVEEHLDPELERHKWEHRADPADFILRR